MPSCTTSPASRRRGLLGPQVLVARVLQREVEGALVVADVVGGAGLPREREGVGADQVRPPHLGRIHPDLGREEVHGPLDGGGGLGAPGAPVGDGGRGVGGHRPAVELDLGDVVGALRHHPREVREDRPHLGVGAAVLEDREAVGLDGAVATAADLDRLLLGPPVAEADHVLAAGLDPAHRPTRPAGPASRAAAPRGSSRSWRRSRRRRRGRSPAPAPCRGRTRRPARRARRGRAGCSTTARAGRRPTRPRRRGPRAAPPPGAGSRTSCVTTTSQPSKKSSVRPKARSTTTFVPAASCSSDLVRRRLGGSTTAGSGS